MKSKEELDALRSELQTVSEKLAELSPGELELVTGGKGESIRIIGSKPGAGVRFVDPYDGYVVGGSPTEIEAG